MYNDYNNPKPDTSVEKVIMYLSHNNKDDMVTTVLNLAKNLQAQQALASNQRVIKDINDPGYRYNSGIEKNVIEIPMNARKLSMEF